MCGEVLHKHIAEIGLDVVVDTVTAAGEIGIAPMVEAIELNILVHQLTYRQKILYQGFVSRGGCDLRRTKLTDGLLVFNLCDAELGRLIRGKTLINRF
jgi:hypothetical protein